MWYIASTGREGRIFPLIIPEGVFSAFSKQNDNDASVKTLSDPEPQSAVEEAEARPGEDERAALQAGRAGRVLPLIPAVPLAFSGPVAGAIFIEVTTSKWI